jgi:hypothetical protein
MATYAEFLKSQGATDDDIKALDTPVARKAFEAQQNAIAAAALKAEEADRVVAANRKWKEEVVQPILDKTTAERDIARAEAAAERARLKQLEEDGLVAKPAAAATTRTDGTFPSGLDPKKFVSVDDLPQFAAAQADAIMLAEDIASEHRVLFPDRPLKFRELRQRAVANNVPVERQWMTEFGVEAAREARAKADREAEQKRWMDEGAKAKEAELASRYGSPETRPAVPSSNPFAKRGTVALAKPNETPIFDRSENQRSNDRVRRAVGGASVQTPSQAVN